ncbi:MAG: TadE/TadG family type IV pilus assembly protein [Acidimicrobiia bacterium]
MIRRVRRAEGQAATELALVVPFFVLLLLLVVQIGLVVRDQVMVVHAAREGARAAAVADAQRIERARVSALAAAGLDRERLDVAVEVGGGRVSVTVTYRSPTDVPVVGRLVGEVSVKATATMALESAT